MKSNFVIVLVLGAFLIGLIAGILAFRSFSQSSQRNVIETVTISPSPSIILDQNAGEVFCTMDAKICPDGSSVGRIPPSCDFAPCPGE